MAIFGTNGLTLLQYIQYKVQRFSYCMFYSLGGKKFVTQTITKTAEIVLDVLVQSASFLPNV